MHARTLALAQLGITRMILDSALADCPQTLVNSKPGGTVSTIGQILTHAVISYDTMVNGGGEGRQPLWNSGGWAAKTSGPADAAYGESSLDLAAFKPYLAEVFASAEALLSSVPDEQLSGEVETPLGKMPYGVVVGGLGLLHLCEHVGDIATLKGMQGMKGLPF